MTHASCMEADLRGLEFAMQSAKNWVNPTPAIQQRLQTEMESHLFGIIAAWEY